MTAKSTMRAGIDASAKHPRVKAFGQGVADANMATGLTFDGSTSSDRSVAYDVGRTVGELPEPFRSLLAAAPDLYAALCTLLQSLAWEEQRSGTTYNGYEQARAALAKASPER